MKPLSMYVYVAQMGSDLLTYPPSLCICTYVITFLQVVGAPSVIFFAATYKAFFKNSLNKLGS